MPRLEVYQSLWAMELRRPDGRERTPEESFEMVAKAGYHGMAIDLAFTDVAAARKNQPLFEKHGLGCLINAFPKTIEALRPVLHMAKDFDACFVNIIGQVMPLSLEGMIPVIRQWLAMAEEEGVEIQFETHRNCITNDLFATLQLLDAIPELRLCADLSHYLVDREFWYPISAENHGLDPPHPRALRLFPGPRLQPRADPGADLLPATPEVVRSLRGLVGGRLSPVARAREARRDAALPLRARPARICDHRARRLRALRPLGGGADDPSARRGDLAAVDRELIVARMMKDTAAD
jgi:hypothetical protein